MKLFHLPGRLLSCALPGVALLVLVSCGGRERERAEARQRLAETQDGLARERMAGEKTAAELARLRDELALRGQELAAARNHGEQQAQQLEAMQRMVDELRREVEAWRQKEQTARAELSRQREAATQSAKSAAAVAATVPKLEETVPRAVVLIEGDRGKGTGFLVAEESHVHLYTAAHVLSGNDQLTVKLHDGTVLRRFSGLECAEGADLVRLGVLDEVKADNTLALVEKGARVPVGTPIIAWGNGGGAGVVARESGKLLGTSDESIEVDAAIIQGNSGGPVVLASDGKVLGLVTHLFAARDDLWAAGTRHAQVRRFACRLDREWPWKALSIADFLRDAKRLEEFDRATRLAFAIAALQPTEDGLRLDLALPGGATVAGIIAENGDQRIVRDLVELNKRLGQKKTKTSASDLNKQLRRIIDQCLSDCARPEAALTPSRMAWFHRRDAETSLEWRVKATTALRERSEGLR